MVTRMNAGKTGKRGIFAVLMFFVFLGCCTCARDSVSADTVQAGTQAVSQAVTGSNAGYGLSALSRNVIADVAERAVKSVVNVSSTKVIKMPGGRVFSPFFNDPFFRYFFGQPYSRNIPKERKERSLGSGVIVSKDGIILTNNHVVAKADQVQVSFGDDKDEYEAKIIGTDPKSDVAVLKIKKKIKGLQPIPFGDSNKLRLGDIVLAIGNPFGLSHTVTMGIVSAKGRANMGITDYENFIQTDAAINPGNSGGAMVNLRGELVGINTAILSRSGGSQGIGFAIPSNMAKSVMESLLKNGRVVRGWLGVVIQDVNKDLADAMKLKTYKGVLISDVIKGSPAKKAGIKRGDVVISVNGTKVNSTGKLRNLIAMLGANAKARLKILRKGKKINISVLLGEQPDNMGISAKVNENQGPLGGLTLGSLNQVNRDKFNIPDKLKEGVVVTDVQQGSPSQFAGLMPGDVILEIDQKPIKSVSDFRKLYNNAKGNILLLVYRKGATMYIVLRR
ncbi:MAG: DegQ family serine endoprotease [Deltaproteobacteria bacterium]|nr:DegQ family serine endoprotease [Deltaproteobacteria bacterium]